jgi:diguanylate cyclase (GGDEF)-like protein/PAS domain S-box-containing protein
MTLMAAASSGFEPRMSDQLLASPALDSPPGPLDDGLRDALMASRQRWRHLVSLAADMAFETDAEGRFVLMIPDTALGWPAGSLIGQPSEQLVREEDTGATFNPFRPADEVRRRRAWLRRADGSLAMMTISTTPLRDAAGHLIGARGIGIDNTGYDAEASEIAGRLRRGQVLHYILSRVKHEAEADSMMDAALWALIHALGTEGAAVIGAVSAGADIEILHECGPGASDVLTTAVALITACDPPNCEPAHAGEPTHSTNASGRDILAAGFETRTGVPAGLAIWRRANSRPWTQEDIAIAASAVCIVHMVLEYEVLQREMAHHARTDPLTGLLNRRAFLEETDRQIARLDRETEGGTLMFVDLDAFKSVNDRLGHAAGDQVLIHLANMLRRLVRPFDLITRLGGDEFAVWLSGADHMTAAERADHLCKTAPGELQEMLPEPFPKLGVSVGIATRRAGSHETIEELTRRADMAMYEVKRSGRRHWRVSLLDGD